MTRTPRPTAPATISAPNTGATSFRRRRAAGAHRGFTAVESLVCITTLLVAVGAALPSFTSALDRHRIEGAAAQLETDLQLTRSVAVAQNRTVRFEIVTDTNGSCYIVHNGSPGVCRCSPQGASCAPGVEVHRSQHYAQDSGVTVAANVRSLVFEPIKGTVTPTATLRVEGRRASIRQIINIMGRIRTCSPDGAVPGLLAC